MPRARKLGRRPRAGKTAAEVVKFRATGDERTRWQSAADRQGISLSEWIRWVLDRVVAK